MRLVECLDGTSLPSTLYGKPQSKSFETQHGKVSLFYLCHAADHPI